MFILLLVRFSSLSKKVMFLVSMRMEMYFFTLVLFSH